MALLSHCLKHSHKQSHALVILGREETRPLENMNFYLCIQIMLHAMMYNSGSYYNHRQARSLNYKWTHFLQNDQFKGFPFEQQKMGSVRVLRAAPNFFSLWYSFYLFCVVLEGINGQAKGWLNAHATFYGANQNPTSLGKSYKPILTDTYLQRSV